MNRRNPPPKERRRPPSPEAKALPEMFFKMPLGGRPTRLRKGEAVPELEYGIDPGGLGPPAAAGKVRYFYVDAERRCATCGVTFVFSAAEQKHFFEKLRFSFYSAPVH